MQPGIMPNGLFWTSQIPRSTFRVNRRSATLKLEGYPLVETYQAFSTAFANPGLVNVEVTWTAIDKPVERGQGGDVPPEDKAAFLGRFSDARVTAKVEGLRPGLNFRSRNLDADDFYGNLGPMRNGSYL